MASKTRVTLLDPITNLIHKPAGRTYLVRRITESRFTVAGIHVLFAQLRDDQTVALETKYGPFVISINDYARMQQLAPEMSDTDLAAMIEQAWDDQNPRRNKYCID